MTKLTFEQIAKNLRGDVIQSIRESYVLSDDDDDMGNERLTSLEVITKYLHGGLDLEIAQKEGLTLRIETDYITIEEPAIDVAILQRIADMALKDEEAHIDLFGNHGMFHDGGDDLDYSGSYYYDLIAIIKDLWEIK